MNKFQMFLLLSLIIVGTITISTGVAISSDQTSCSCLANTKNINTIDQTPADGGTIYIAAAPGTKFNVTEIQVEKNTRYTVVFINEQTGESHNLVIVDPNTLATTDNIASYESNILIGPASTDFSQPGGANKSWSYEWITPNEDSWVQYGCSFIGHFPTMNGWLKVGNPGAKPAAASQGFEILISIFVVMSVAIHRLRKK